MLYFIEATKKRDISQPFQALQILENAGLEDTIEAIWVPVLSGMYTHVSMFSCILSVVIRAVFLQHRLPTI